MFFIIILIAGMATKVGPIQSRGTDFLTIATSKMFRENSMVS